MFTMIINSLKDFKLVEDFHMSRAVLLGSLVEKVIDSLSASIQQWDQIFSLKKILTMIKCLVILIVCDKYKTILSCFFFTISQLIKFD